MENFILGLTGSFGSGCSTTSDLISSERDFNFTSFSLSNLLKKEAKKRFPKFNSLENKKRRELLQDLGNTIRKEKGRSYLVESLIPEIKKNLEKNNIIIDSIRNTEEIMKLKEEFENFVLISINADFEKRWDRLKELYDNDKESFIKDDKRDSGENEPPLGQQVKKCIEKADIFINNNENFYDLEGNKNKIIINNYGDKIKDYLNILLGKSDRLPNSYELFMCQTFLASLRSRCLKRKVGASIISEEKNDQGEIINNLMLISSCNNVPKNTVDCINMAKCQRDKKKQEFVEKTKFCRKCGNRLNDEKICEKCGNNIWEDMPSKILDLCRSVHVEESVILEAGNFGINLKDKILYTTTFPCLLCTKIIITAGIKRIVFIEPYPVIESIEMLKESHILMEKYEGINPRVF